MTEYQHNADKWLIIQHKPAAGGKFLAACLMTIDAVAHWDQAVYQHTKSYTTWVDESWSQDRLDKWIAYEPLHDWEVRFFSRTWPRGNDLTIKDYNQLIVTASDYFKEVWLSDKRVLDFIIKEQIPAWWTDSKLIKLDARPNCAIHRKMLLSKLYPWDPITGIGINMLDHPIEENKSKNAQKFANQYKFGPFDDIDQWYKFIWDNDFRLNFTINNPDIYLDELLEWHRLQPRILKIADELNSNIDIGNLKYIYNHWITKNKQILE